MVYADEILDYSGQRKTGVLAGSYGPSADVSPEAGETITVPQLTVNEKGLITGAAERTVTLPSGGGGGGEEQFQKVYETTLTEAASNIEISSQDIGGTYVDIVVFVTVGESVQSWDSIKAGFFANETLLNSCFFAVEEDAAPVAFSFGIASEGGLLRTSIRYLGSNSYQTGETFYDMPPAAFSEVYPTETAIGADNIKLMCTTGNFSSGTTITVYARRKVTPNAQA